MIYNFQRLVRIDRSDIHGNHNIKVCIRNIREHIVFQTCRQVLYEQRSRVLVAPHEIVLFELKVIGAAVRSFRTSCEVILPKHRYLFINVSENILEHNYTVIGSQRRELRSDLLESIVQVNIYRIEFRLCTFEIGSLHRYRQVLVSDDTVLPLFHFLNEHFVVNVDVVIEAVALVL